MRRHLAEVLPGSRPPPSCGEASTRRSGAVIRCVTAQSRRSVFRVRRQASLSRAALPIRFPHESRCRTLHAVNSRAKYPAFAFAFSAATGTGPAVRAGETSSACNRRSKLKCRLRHFRRHSMSSVGATAAGALLRLHFLAVPLTGLRVGRRRGERMKLFLQRICIEGARVATLLLCSARPRSSGSTECYLVATAGAE
jgi:hypothetical protein